MTLIGQAYPMWLQIRGAWLPTRTGLLMVLVAALALAGCGDTQNARAPSSGVRQTISFAVSGLTEEEAPELKRTIKAFEAQNPGVRVSLDVLAASSPNSGVYVEELERQLRSRSSTPDLMELEVTKAQPLASAGLLAPLSRFHPDLQRFFPAEVTAGELGGMPFAVPWTDVPEGLFYRTDLLPRAPRTPAEVLADARTASAKDRELNRRPLNEPFAFAGYKAEAITTFETVASAFGGGLTAQSIDTKPNVEALEWLRKAIYVAKITPKTAATWDQGPVQDDFSAGRTAFALDTPFVAANLEPGSPATGRLAYVPFPPRHGGKPGAALSGEMLAIGQKSPHIAIAYKLAKYLTSQQVEIARAEGSFTPPALRAAYDAALYATKPIFRQVKLLNEDAEPGLLSPRYPQIAQALASALTAVMTRDVSAYQAMNALTRTVPPNKGHRGKA